MRPVVAWLAFAALAAASALALLAPWPVVLGLALVGLVAARRSGLWWFAALTVALNTGLMAWLGPGGPHAGAVLGAAGGLRIVALVAANLALLDRLGLALWLDALRLPRRWTAFLAAVLLTARDLGRDLEALRTARVLDGTWPTSRWARVRAAAGLLPALMVASWRRAESRREAFRSAGLDLGDRFAPIVAVAALAVAGRMAFIALPNVSLTYVVVFTGGLAFGARAGFWGGFWAMALTDLALSGLAPAAYVNAPAMGLLGLLGGAVRALRPGLSRADRWGDRLFTGTLGVLGTLLFSVVTDVATWALVPEFRTSADLLRLRVVAGLVFNVVPAAINGALFALSVGPVHRAVHAVRATRAPAARPRPVPASAAAPPRP